MLDLLIEKKKNEQLTLLTSTGIKFASSYSIIKPFLKLLLIRQDNEQMEWVQRQTDGL